MDTKTITKAHVDQLIHRVTELKKTREAILNEVDASANQHGHWPDGMTLQQTGVFDDVDEAISTLERKLRWLRSITK